MKSKQNQKNKETEQTEYLKNQINMYERMLAYRTEERDDLQGLLNDLLSTSSGVILSHLMLEMSKNRRLEIQKLESKIEQLCGVINDERKDRLKEKKK